MKFKNAICMIILAATASAAALPAPGPRCGKVGEPCGRSALPLPESFAEPEDAGLNARCNLVGGACYEAKRMTRELASLIALSTRDPKAYYDGLDLEDEESKFSTYLNFFYRAIINDPVASDIIAREAEARCGKKGEPCGKFKREADPEAEARCGKVGEPCGKLRRAAEAIAEAIADPEYKYKTKRNAEALAEADARCGKVGEPCGKAKRDAHALASAIDSVPSQL